MSLENFLAIMTDNAVPKDFFREMDILLSKWTFISQILKFVINKLIFLLLLKSLYRMLPLYLGLSNSLFEGPCFICMQLCT